MAAVRVTAPLPGDGAQLAALWRELWVLHEGWGGYRAARNPECYQELAERLELAARARAGDPVCGSHLHWVARADDGTLLGQVEGWLQPAPSSAHAAFSCELRSLVVAPRARGRGVGRALVLALAELARESSYGAVFLHAEVLCENPARGFYERLGMRPFASAHLLLPPRAPLRWPAGLQVRRARPSDALELLRLRLAHFAERRREGDARAPRALALDAVWLRQIAAELSAKEPLQEPWVLSQNGKIVAEATFWTHPLEPPFALQQRAAVEHFALTPGHPQAMMHASLLLAHLAQRGAQHGAAKLELCCAPPAWSSTALGQRTRYSLRTGQLLPAR